MYKGNYSTFEFKYIKTKIYLKQTNFDIQSSCYSIARQLYEIEVIQSETNKVFVAQHSKNSIWPRRRIRLTISATLNFIEFTTVALSCIRCVYVFERFVAACDTNNLKGFRCQYLLISRSDSVEILLLSRRSER